MSQKINAADIDERIHQLPALWATSGDDRADEELQAIRRDCGRSRNLRHHFIYSNLINLPVLVDARRAGWFCRSPAEYALEACKSRKGLKDLFVDTGLTILPSLLETQHGGLVASELVPLMFRAAEDDVVRTNGIIDGALAAIHRVGPRNGWTASHFFEAAFAACGVNPVAKTRVFRNGVFAIPELVERAQDMEVSVVYIRRLAEICPRKKYAALFSECASLAVKASNPRPDRNRSEPTAFQCTQAMRDCIIKALGKGGSALDFT